MVGSSYMLLSADRCKHTAVERYFSACALGRPSPRGEEKATKTSTTTPLFPPHVAFPSAREQVEAEADQWTALGFSTDGEMVGSDAVIYQPEADQVSEHILSARVRGWRTTVHGLRGRVPDFNFFG